MCIRDSLEKMLADVARPQDHPEGSSGSATGVGAGCALAMCMVVLVCAPSEEHPLARGGSRMLMGDSCASDPSETQHVVGTVLGWVSATIYLNSRLPQVYKNFKTKTVEGLSWLMFFCAVMGNLTYALGVLLRATSWHDVNAALPWLVGSIGTVVFDFIIITQCMFYRNPTDDQVMAAHKDRIEAGSPAEHSGWNQVKSRVKSGSFIERMLHFDDGTTPVYLDSKIVSRSSVPVEQERAGLDIIDEDGSGALNAPLVRDSDWSD
eukprot:TRINITY_DN17729_c0_g1_i2.p1 TRINITY_DN17729_c0_g1~~TRINITY_DN17729_c0_g1_i2.p1  ORF type:complete len:264 (+),score=52.66 TRINITY_DN17729_c0_g1_i2:165-956(+)